MSGLEAPAQPGALLVMMTTVPILIQEIHWSLDSLEVHCAFARNSESCRVMSSHSDVGSKVRSSQLQCLRCCLKGRTSDKAAIRQQ